MFELTHRENNLKAVGNVLSIEGARSRSKKSELSPLTSEIVSTKEALLEVTKLRAKAYAHKGKISKKYKTLTDRFDSQSLIIAVKDGEKAVGSVRVIFYGKGDISETEEFVGLPSTYQDRESWVEVSRLCVHPEYQQSHVFRRLIKELFKVLVLSGKTKVLAGATGRLTDMYLNLGAKKLGISYKHEQLKNLDHELVEFVHFTLSLLPGEMTLLLS